MTNKKGSLQIIILVLVLGVIIAGTFYLAFKAKFSVDTMNEPTKQQVSFPKNPEAVTEVKDANDLIELKTSLDSADTELDKIDKELDRNTEDALNF